MTDVTYAVDADGTLHIPAEQLTNAQKILKTLAPMVDRLPHGGVSTPQGAADTFGIIGGAGPQDVALVRLLTGHVPTTSTEGAGARVTFVNDPEPIHVAETVKFVREALERFRGTDGRVALARVPAHLGQILVTADAVEKVEEA